MIETENALRAEDTKEVVFDESDIQTDEYAVDAEALKEIGVENLQQSDFLSAMLLSGETLDFKPLVEQFSTKVGKNTSDTETKMLAGQGYSGKKLWDVLAMEYSEDKDLLVDIALEMFPHENPLTNLPDIDLESEITPYIPLVILSDTMYPQYDKEGVAYFNPNGVFTVAEFVDSLYLLKWGRQNSIDAKKSLDGLSDVNDFYNRGYNSCLQTISSPFYRLYSRSDMQQPLTRLELAYITVVCWSEFTKRYSIYSGRYKTGISMDWNSPQEYLINFKDGFNYVVCRKDFRVNTVDSTNAKINVAILDTDINNYIQTANSSADNLYSMHMLRRGILDGNIAIPLPMLMSMLELDAFGLFNYKGVDGEKELRPMAEVTRGEMCYFLIKLAKLFSNI